MSLWWPKRLTNAVLRSTDLNKGFENAKGRVGGARVGCGGQVLMLGRAPQDRRSPLYMAAMKGHLKVVQVLILADADKEFRSKVREGRGGDVGRTNDACFFCWGLPHGC